MEPLFRLMLKRPAIEQDAKNPSIPLAQNSNYQAALATAMQADDPRRVLRAATKQFVGTAAYFASPDQVPLSAGLRLLSDEFAALESKAAVTPAAIAKAIKDSVGDDPGALVKKQAYTDAVVGLKDSILAIKQLPEEHGRPIEVLTRMLRDLEVVSKADTDAAFPGTGDRLARYRRRSLRMPTQADLRSILSTREKGRKDEEELRKQEEAARKGITDKAGLYERLKQAVQELMGLDNQHLESSLQTAHGGSMPPYDARPLSAFAADLARKQVLGQLQVLHARTESAKEDAIGKAALAAQAAIVTPAAHGRQFFPGSSPFQPIPASATMFRFKAGTELLLSESTKQILWERRLSISAMPVDEVVARLRGEMEALSADLDRLTGGQVRRSFKRVGKALVMLSTPKPSSWTLASMGGPITFGQLLALDSRIPHSKGNVAPASVADLIVVKQQVKRYEGVDVAHIENVLKGELKVRDHRRLQQTEDITVRESETTKTEERELESTDRFEMSRETSTTIKEDASLKAGLSISGSYGPTVEFAASAEGALSRSKEEATKTASTFSKDVTQRSSSKLTERMLERTTRRVLNEVEEKNNHTLNNVAGAGHIAGVYQWVNKVYEAQMFNYGLRMMYDFMVPEPGAFLSAAMLGAHAHALQVEKPAPFTLKPDQITETNYHYWVHQYGAGGVQPPPEEYRTESLDYHAGNGDDKTEYLHSGIIQIAEGYKAVFASVTGGLFNLWEDDCSVDVAIGQRTHRFTKGSAWVWTTSLDNERQSIPFGLKTFRISDLAAVLEVKCQRTDRALKKWQLETHAKLMDAYQGKLADYEATLAALEMQAGVAIQGKNPALNLELMKDELKKNCISILTAQHYDLFAAIQTGTNGLPQINLYENEAEGPYVRFFEQAFEWEQITWVTYPYFWGRKDQWDERIALEDTDPLFNQFVKAGYCRTVVPVRPGFEGAVDHFLTFGEIWNGGPLPAIGNPLYLPIADEIAERLARPGAEIPQGDPWEVLVPTSLVHLRLDDKLPVWQKNAQGEWVPV